MVGMFRCMIEYLTHGTKEGTTNYEAPSHPRGGVQVTSIVFVGRGGGGVGRSIPGSLVGEYLVARWVGGGGGHGE